MWATHLYGFRYLRIARFKECRPSFPLVGICIEGIYGTYLSLPLNTVCDIRLDMRVSHCKNGPCIELGGVDEPLRSAIEKFLYEFLLQAGFSNIELEGTITLKCGANTPLISLYVATTNFIIEEFLSVEELRRVLSSIAVIDSIALRADPGYTLSLRCASSFKTPCITRGVNEILRLRGVASIGINDLLSTHRTEVQSRDLIIPKIVETNRRIVSLYLKVVSTAIPEIIDLIELGRKESEKYLRLVLYTELALSEVSLSKWVRLPKVVPDINAVVIYDVKVLS